MNKIEQAIQLIEQNELKEAVNILREYVKEANDEELISMADLFIELGLLDDVRPILESLLDKYPEATDIKLALAEIYVDLEEDEQALVLLQEFDMSSDNYLSSLLLSADLYQTQGLFEVAEQKLIEAKRLAPQETLIDFAQGELAFSIGKYPQAVTHYEKVLKEHNELAEVDISLRIAESLAQVGEFERALDYYKTAKLETPGELFQYGFIAFQINRLDIAIKTWEELLKHDPEYASAYHYLAEAYEKEGFIEKGYETVIKGLEVDSLNTELLLTAASLARQLGEQEESYRYARESVAIDPGFRDGILYLIENYRSDDDFESIIELLTHTIEQGEEDGSYKWELAKAYEEEESYELALKNYQDAYHDFKDDSDFLKTYGYFLVEEGRKEEAIVIFKRYLTIDPSDLELESYLVRLME